MKSPATPRRLATAALAVAMAALVSATGHATAGGAVATPGSAGIDTSLPATDSQVTVRGSGPFSDLQITVNQTRDLGNQAVSITWKGATPTRTGPSRFAAHYLQVMQCWGDDDGMLPGNPGPPPEQCVQGATDAVYGGRNIGLFPSGGFALERIVSRRDWPNFDPADGHLDERTGYLWKPFRAVDGEVVGTHYDPAFNPSLAGGSFWLNPYFNAITTNEVAGGRTGPNGTGAALFEVTTGLESSGLGCGRRIEPVPGGPPRIPRCWLVIVPRGSPADENAGTPFEEKADQAGVFTSPLAPRAWRNRIAVPLEFNPVDTPCSLGDDQRRIVGTELLAPAVSSWQPRLCATPGLPPYAYGSVGDAGARQQLLSGVAGAPGLIVVSRPIDPESVSPANPVTYAPLSVSSVVVGFNIERVPNLQAPPEAEELRGIRIAELNLTPRLLAKLLTQSYRSQVAIKGPPPYDWAKTNPAHLGRDPDFLQFNPEFTLLESGGKNLGGLITTARNSDVARQVWEYILADPEAKAWLDGTADAWGMRVNPVYASTATANTTGVPFGDPAPQSFPKSDPYCYQAPPQGPGGSIVPPPLCGPDWMPYSQSMRDAARVARAADDGARTTEDPLAPSADKVYRPDGPQILGSRAILSLTDSASAYQYGLQTARLSRAGDDGPDRVFVAPDVPGMTAGVAAMAAKDEPTVLEPDPRTQAPAAYPLTALTYAAVAPLALDDRARQEYAAFVEFAAGAGQDAGLKLGQLPPGYAPLSDALRAQAVTAATTIRELRAATESQAVEPLVPEVFEPEAATAAAIPTPAAGLVPGPAATAVSPSSPGAVADDEAYIAAGNGEPEAPPQAASPPDAAASESPASLLKTAVVAVARSRFVLPALASIALLSALGALEITKRPRYAPALARVAGRPAGRRGAR